MLISTIIIVLLQGYVLGFSTLAQLINYALLVVNGIYTLVITVFIVPTYKQHKLNTKDYNDRNNPSAVELRTLEKTKIDKMEKDIAEIKHAQNNLTTQLTPLLKKLNDEPDLGDLLKAINKLNDKL